MANAADAIADTLNLKSVSETHSASHSSTVPHTSTGVAHTPQAVTLTGTTAVPAHAATATGSTYAGAVPAGSTATNPPAVHPISGLSATQMPSAAATVGSHHSSTQHKHPHMEKLMHKVEQHMDSHSHTHSAGHSLTAGPHSSHGVSQGVSGFGVQRQGVYHTSHLVGGAVGQAGGVAVPAATVAAAPAGVVGMDSAVDVGVPDSVRKMIASQGTQQPVNVIVRPTAPIN